MYCTRSQGYVKDQTDIPDLRACEILQDRDEVEQLVVMCVREPAADRNGMLWMKDV